MRFHSKYLYLATTFAQDNPYLEPQLKLLLVLLAFTLSAAAQTPVGPSTGKMTLHLSGSASAIAGATEETGTFTFSLDGDGSTSLDISGGSLSRKLSCGPFAERPNCNIQRDGTSEELALHNSLLALDWIVPKLSLDTLRAQLTVTPSDTGRNLQILRRYANVRGKVGALFEKLSVVTVELGEDGLPTQISFNEHPEDDANTDIPITVKYFDYRNVNGVWLPYRIEKYLNNGLVLDLRVQAADVNVGVGRIQ